MTKILCSLFLLPCLAIPASAAPRATAEKLVKSDHSWDGHGMHYSSGTPELTVSRVVVPKGARIPVHCHPVPLAAYVSQGELQVIKTDGESHIFKTGDAFIEVMDQWHRGVGLAEKTELIVFYAGEKDLGLSVKQGGLPAGNGLCR